MPWAFLFVPFQGRKTEFTDTLSQLSLMQSDVMHSAVSSLSWRLALRLGVSHALQVSGGLERNILDLEVLVGPGLKPELIDLVGSEVELAHHLVEA